MEFETLPVLGPSHLTIFVVLISISISILLYLLFSVRVSSKRPRYAPDLQSYPIIGHLPQLFCHQHRFLEWITDMVSASPTNTVFIQRPGGVREIMTANPINVEHMLKSNFENYPKGPLVHENLRDFLGIGIFNSDGPLWRLQRKIASFEFNTRSLRSFVHRAVAHEISSRLLPLLCFAASSGQSLDLQETLERFAFDNICKVAFDVDPASLDSHSSTIGFTSAFRDAAELSSGRFRYAFPGFWKVKKALNIGSERRLRESIITVHEFSMQIIRSRKKDQNRSSPVDDLLARFIANEGNNSDEFLRDIIISFLLAGRDTTSSALTWFFWLLSSRPDVENRILAEIAAIRGRSGAAAGSALELEELREMQYLHAAITEAMRLYPPVPLNSTACAADEVLPDGTEIKKGWSMSYSSYAMGRMEGIWGKDCREYRPERWLDGGAGFEPESPFRFPVFHGGPRMCLGKDMAYIQMKSIAVCVLEGFDVEMLRSKDTSPEQVWALTLRMKGGLPVRVRERAMRSANRTVPGV